jgi:hypothetical protein
MDFEIITKIFAIGKYLALTPAGTTNVSPTLFQKLYVVFVFSVYIAGIVINFYSRNSLYLNLPTMQLVLRVLLTADLLAHSYYSIIVVGLFKRHKWIVLIKNLKSVENKNSTIRWYYLLFVWSHILLLLVTTFIFYAWIKRLGLEFFKIYLGEYLQMYALFFNTLLCRIVLKMILTRYRHQSTLMSHLVGKKNPQLHILIKVKNNLVKLRQTVDSFNDLFGWTILLNVMFVALRSLIYFDLVLRLNKDEYALQIISHAGVMLFNWVRCSAKIRTNQTCFKHFFFKSDNLKFRSESSVLIIFSSAG